MRDMKRLIIAAGVAGLNVAGCGMAIATPADDRNYAIRVACDVQAAGPVALQDLQFQQGATPLLSIDTYANGKSVTADTSGVTVARFVMAPSATNLTFVAVTNLAAAVTGNGYLIQLPTVGTNTAGNAEGWWYSVRLERGGYLYWSGSGRLDIEATTSTENGLVWQSIGTGTSLAQVTNIAAALDAADRSAASNLYATITHTQGADTITNAPWLTNYTINAGSEIVVDQGCKGNYTTIGAALAYAATVHATNATALVNIRVVAGIYAENITVSANTLIRGDARKSIIDGKTIVVSAPVYFDGMYFYQSGATATNTAAIEFIGNGSSVSSLFNCFIVNDRSFNGPVYGVLINYCTNSVIRIRKSEVYARNSNSGTASKTICIGAFTNVTGYVELIVNKMKTSATSSGPTNSEYLCWIDGTLELEMERCNWYSLHAEYPKIHCDGTSHVAWEGSNLSNWEVPENSFITEGTSALPVLYFANETGNLKVNGDLTVTGAITGDGTGLTGVVKTNDTRYLAAITNMPTAAQVGAVSTSAIPGPGCTDLGAVTDVTITGATTSWRVQPAGVYTVNVAQAASRYCYALEIVSTNACTLGTGLALQGSWTVTGTNVLTLVPCTGTLWRVYGRGL